MDRFLILASSFICIKQVMTLFNSGNGLISYCMFISYIIERGHRINGKIVGKMETNAFQDCIQCCSKSKECTAVNFALNERKNPVCLLVDQAEEMDESKKPIPKSIIYSATSFCLNQKIPSNYTDRSKWSFEKFSNMDLIDDSFAKIAVEEVSLEKCLNFCLKKKKCRAVLYNTKTEQCRFSNVSIQNVYNVKQYFERNDDVDLYENNYLPENLVVNSAQCHFIQMQSFGFTDLFDERFTNVADTAECQQLCLNWSDSNCRYFTYHQGTRLCYLSHTSPRTLNKNPLQNYNINLSSGDLQDCVQFKLKCKPDRMHLHGLSMKIFSGTLKAKNDNIFSCEEKFLNVYEFHAEMLYTDCGIQKTFSSHLTYTNIVMLKEGSTELITVKDKLLKLVCHIHNDFDFEQQLSYGFQTENENVTKQMSAKNIQKASQLRNYVAKPRYTLEVMDVSKNPAQVVKIGDEGYLLLTLNENSTKFFITDLLARDTKSGKTHTIIDSDGCIIPNGMLKDIHRIDENHLQLNMVFKGFPDETDIIYEAYAIPCDEFCDRTDCKQIHSIKSQQIKNKNIMRKRRSVMTPSESRLVEIDRDIYAVKSSHKLKLKENLRKKEAGNFLESNDFETNSLLILYDESLNDVTANAKERSTTLSHLVCITDDFKCLIIFLALFLQALALIVIIAITYIIIQHCMRQRNSEIVGLIQRYQ